MYRACNLLRVSKFHQSGLLHELISHANSLIVGNYALIRDTAFGRLGRAVASVVCVKDETAWLGSSGRVRADPRFRVGSVPAGPRR